jgi:hypothetical protein
MIISTRNKAAKFSAPCWIENSGSALATEANPTDLASVTGIATNLSGLGGRIITTPAGIFVTGGVQIIAYAVGGTSCTVRFWWYDDVKRIWIANGAVVTLTTATTNSGTTTFGCMPGSRWFAQIVTNTGVTAVAVLVR